MSHPADARRRWFGAFFLLMALGMLIWGLTVLRPILGEGLLFVLYWLACFAFTGFAILTALLDLWIVRLRSREAQRDLLERTIGNLGPEKKDPPSKPASKPRS